MKSQTLALRRLNRPLLTPLSLTKPFFLGWNWSRLNTLVNSLLDTRIIVNAKGRCALSIAVQSKLPRTPVSVVTSDDPIFGGQRMPSTFGLSSLSDHLKSSRHTSQPLLVSTASLFHFGVDSLCSTAFREFAFTPIRSFRWSCQWLHLSTQ